MSDDDYDTDTDEMEEEPVALPSYPLTPLDLIGWVITGAAHSIGAVANTLGNIANEFFIAGRYQREEQDRTDMARIYDTEFNNIIAQPVLLDDPEEE